MQIITMQYMRFSSKNALLLAAIIGLLQSGCKDDKSTKSDAASSPVFELLEKERTGIDFSNDLKLSLDLNIFNYMYFYNGGGVGAGDFNNDGRIDLFFAANLKDNALYLNEGGMKFKNISQNSGILAKGGGWCTGVSVVDINNDGLLDIYVGQVGEFEILNGRNQLFVCKEIRPDGTPVYEEKAKEYGLALVGFSTHAVFFDYDLDGDLDMFQMNHSLHKNGTFGPRKVFMGTFHPLSGDKLLRNDKGKFIDVTKNAGINSTVLGYGLGICVSDLNNDGWPDIYIGNDFHENDYLYLNQKNGTFKEVLPEQMMHTSRFSMGVDVGDINNDLQEDVISLDMLPYDPEILKKSEGEDATDLFYFKLNYGYNAQYARNALQVNNGDGTFSETAMYSGVFATDWSWASLFFDYDNDGKKDLFVSNGIPKRMNDIDYIKFVADDDFQAKINFDALEEKDLQQIEKIPEVKLYNQLFKNEGDLKFANMGKGIANDKISYSNGAVYADLDNDGDLDLVTNNINDPAFVYENKTATPEKAGHYLRLALEGAAQNRNAIGAKALVYKKQETLLFEKFPVHGYMSSMEGPWHLGLGAEPVDSIVLVWPDQTYEKLNLTNIPTDRTLKVTYKPGLLRFDFKRMAKRMPVGTKIVDLTPESGLDFVHQENTFVEFNREPLIPHVTSTEGPALAVGDLNGDGLDDIFVGNAKHAAPVLYFQDAGGHFSRQAAPALRADSVYEDVEALILDVDGDGDKDLLVGTGGNEFSNNVPEQQSRVYLNDGKGNLTRNPTAFQGLFPTVSTLQPCDINGDGFVDLFMGARSVVSNYGLIPQSYLVLNDGKGNFKDVTESYCPALREVGLVKNSVWCDLDKDGKQDLVVLAEWEGIRAFMWRGDQFKAETLTDKKGFWNFALPVDVDNDGDLDLIAGNHGQNHRLKATPEEPIRMYYNDFDNNGKKEQVLTFYLEGRNIPYANYHELQKQIPLLKKDYLRATDFAKASLEDIFTKEKLKKARLFEADFFDSALLLNQGNGKLELHSLPYQAQLTPFKAAAVVDANGDQLPDVLMYGNFYGSNVQMGRYDADYGTLLLNKGAGQFDAVPVGGARIKGEVRRMASVTVGGKPCLILARNSDAVRLIRVER